MVSLSEKEKKKCKKCMMVVNLNIGILRTSISSPYNINQITDQVTKIRRHLFHSLQGHSKCEYYAYYKNTLKFTYISESLNFPCHFSSYKKVLRIKSVESGCKR